MQGDRSPPKQLFIWNGACNRAVHKSERGLLLTSVRQWFGEPPRHYTGWQPPESNLRLTGVRQWFRTTAPLYRLYTKLVWHYCVSRAIFGVAGYTATSHEDAERQ